MVRGILTLILVLAFAASLDAARKQKRNRVRVKPKAKAEETAQPPENPEHSTRPDKNAKHEEPEHKEDEATEETAAAPVYASDEMEVFRAIEARSEATVQDLIDVLLMYRGEYGKYKTADERANRIRELKLLKNQKGSDLLERGTLAYALMKAYRPESGWLFWLTGWERYAMRDIQEAEIMPTKATPNQHLSGAQLLGTITAAQEYAENKKQWSK